MKTDKAARQAAKRAWREREAQWQIVALRIGPGVWLRLTPDAGALENRLRFMLRQGGGGLAPAIRSAHAEARNFTLERLERLRSDLTPLARERIGKARLAHWAERLGAGRF